MTTGDWVQVILLGALILITGFYAWQTRRASNAAERSVKVTEEMAKATKEQAEATKQQADASVNMAEEMREQRLYMAQPRLIPDLRSTSRGKFFVKEFTVAFWNEGVGTAVNAEFSVSHSLYKFNVSEVPQSHICRRPP